MIRPSIRAIAPLALALALALMLSACSRSGSSGKPFPIPTSVSLGDVPAAPNAPAGALPQLNDAPARPLYSINATLDYASGIITAQQRIDFINPAGRSTNEVRFNVPPARRAGAVAIRDVRIHGSDKSLVHSLDNAVLTVRLPAELSAGAGIALTFDFTVHIPLQEVISGIGGDDTSRGPFSLTAGHWYIMLAPFHDGQWDTPAYVPIGDPYTSELADYEVSILAPDDIIIAGAGDESRSGRLWNYSLQKARVFAFAASNVYAVETLEQNGVTFIHYGYPVHKQHAGDVLFTAARAVDLFTKLYGPYPYKSLRIVETGRQQGQEYSAMVGIGSILYDGYSGRGSRHDLIATTVHETSHQWWFNVVGSDQIRSPWLDESFARMAELRFYQTYYDADSDWWFSHYIASRRPAGPIDLSLAEYADSASYITGVYQRGLLFLNDVRKTLGRDRFDEMLHDYYTAQEYSITSQDAFFDALARHSSDDLRPLVRGYFAKPVTLPCAIAAGEPGCR